MNLEFDGATEKEAVQNAIDELRIQDFEYEIISETKRGLFKKPSVVLVVGFNLDSSFGCVQCSDLFSEIHVRAGTEIVPFSIPF